MPLGYCQEANCIFIKNSTRKSRCCLFWRRVWDSNPRGIAPKRFSRPPRYDRFDNPPCVRSSSNELNIPYSIFSAPPRYVLLRCPKFFVRHSSQNFDRCHAVSLACSATGSARQRPHFDIPPNISSRLSYHKAAVLSSFPGVFMKGGTHTNKNVYGVIQWKTKQKNCCGRFTERHRVAAKRCAALRRRFGIGDCWRRRHGRWRCTRTARPGRSRCCRTKIWAAAHFPRGIGCPCGALCGWKLWIWRMGTRSPIFFKPAFGTAPPACGTRWLALPGRIVMGMPWHWGGDWPPPRPPRQKQCEDCKGNEKRLLRRATASFLIQLEESPQKRDQYLGRFHHNDFHTASSSVFLLQYMRRNQIGDDPLSISSTGPPATVISAASPTISLLTA